MISDNREHSPSPTCSEHRVALEQRFDNETRVIADEGLDRHVESCLECAAFARDLQDVRSLVRALPETPFPTNALDEVLRQTVDRPVLPSPFVFVRRHLVNVALAAVVTLAAIGAWFATNGGDMTGEYSEAELVRLERDLNEIMTRLGSTLRDSEQVAIREVLIEEAAPPLQQSPFVVPTPPTP